jgi:hypothetical protein
MKSRVLFIPWAINLEQFGKCLNWQATALFRKGKWTHIIHYNPIPNPILLFVTDGQIYVRGHGGASDPEIAPGFGALGGDLDYAEVGRRLMRTGLRKCFKGVIKLYNCHSAEGGTASFASQFANFMRGQGYTNCTYEGYDGALDSYYQDKGGNDGDYHKFSGNGTGEADRASNHRHAV